MTKRREPLTYHRALTQVAARIGWDRCGAICGVTERAVRYWSDPDAETEIRLIDAERLDKAYLASGGTHAPFNQLFTLRLDLASHRGDCADLAHSAARSAKETGEAVSALVMASTPGADRAVIRKARKEIEEAIETLTDSLTALDQHTGTEG